MKLLIALLCLATLAGCHKSGGGSDKPAEPTPGNPPVVVDPPPVDPPTVHVPAAHLVSAWEGQTGALVPFQYGNAPATVLLVSTYSVTNTGDADGEFTVYGEGSHVGDYTDYPIRYINHTYTLRPGQVFRTTINAERTRSGKFFVYVAINGVNIAGPATTDPQWAPYTELFPMPMGNG